MGIWGYTINEAAAAYSAGSNEKGPWTPQLRMVDEAEELVTVTIGFNDMQFSDCWDWLTAYRTRRASARADSLIRQMGPDLDTLFGVLERAEKRQAKVVLTMMYHPYAGRGDNPPGTSGCGTMHGIADLITGKLNAEMERRGDAAGFLIADFRPAFEGHGAGSRDSFVWGSRCNLSGAIQSGSPDWNDGEADGKRGVQERFDPHPNGRGTKAMSEAILKVVR